MGLPQPCSSLVDVLGWALCLGLSFNERQVPKRGAHCVMNVYPDSELLVVFSYVGYFTDLWLFSWKSRKRKDKEI